MKKFTLSLTLAIGMFYSASAQVSDLLPTDPDRTNLQIVEPATQYNSFDRRQDGGGWYSFLTSYTEFNGLTIPGNTFVTWMYPDSSAQIISDNGVNRIRFHVTGSVFDPKDPLFSPNQFSRWNNYTLDTLAWLQFYIRNVDKMDQIVPVAASGTLTVVDFSFLSSAIFSIDGIDLTEGIDWNAETDNNITASSLGAAIAALQFSGSALYTVSIDANTITITYNTVGASGNNVTLTTTDATNLAISGSTLSGGGIQITEVDIVDTLYVQYYTRAGGGIPNPTEFWYTSALTDTLHFAQPNPTTFNTSSLLNSSAIKTDTLFLTAEFKDSIAGNQVIGSVRFTTPGISIMGSNTETGNIIASTFTFKPMKPYNFKDTVLDFRTSGGGNVSNKHNVLGMRMAAFTDHQHRISKKAAINHSLLCNFEVRYGQTLTNLLNIRAYIPGIFFGSTLFTDHSYHISTQNLNVVTPNTNGYGLGDAYPNPTDNAEAFTIPFSLGASDLVMFTVTDITGKIVKRISNNYSAGENIVTIETTGLTTGVYFYTMTTGAFSGVGKVIVR